MSLLYVCTSINSEFNLLLHLWNFTPPTGHRLLLRGKTGKLKAFSQYHKTVWRLITCQNKCILLYSIIYIFLNFIKRVCMFLFHLMVRENHCLQDICHGGWGVSSCAKKTQHLIVLNYFFKKKKTSLMNRKSHCHSAKKNNR